MNQMQREIIAALTKYITNTPVSVVKKHLQRKRQHSFILQYDKKVAHQLGNVTYRSVVKQNERAFSQLHST